MRRHVTSLNQEGRLDSYHRLGVTRANWIEFLFEVTGPFDAQRWQHALREVARRHEPLRSSFSWRDGLWYADVWDDWTPPIEVVDCDSEEAALAAAGEAVRTTPFAPEAPTLVRTVLINGGGRQFLLLLVEHIVCDGLSLRPLFRELLHFYAWPHRELPPLDLSYGDFAEAQRTATADGEAAAYWTSVLMRNAVFPPPLPVPTLPGPAEYGAEAAEWREYDAEASTWLTGRARELRTTAFAVTLASTLLGFRRCGWDPPDGVMVPVAGRSIRGTQQLVGWFAYNVPLMVGRDAETLPDLTRTITRQVLAALRHDLPITPLAAVIRPGDIAPVPRHPYLFFDIADARRAHTTAAATGTGPALPLTAVRPPPGLRRRLQPGISVVVTVDAPGPRLFTAQYGTGQYSPEVVGALAEASVAGWRAS